MGLRGEASTDRESSKGIGAHRGGLEDMGGIGGLMEVKESSENRRRHRHTVGGTVGDGEKSLFE